MFSNQIQGYEKDIVKLFDFSPDLCGISRVADGKILVVNRSFCQLFEYEKQELLGKTSTELDLYYYKDRDRFSETLKRDKQLTNYEVRVQTKSGKILTLIVEAFFIEYKKEQCISFQAHDITDRKAIEEKLRLKNRELERAQEIAKIGSWYLDLKTNEVSWTEELYKMYGFDPSKPVPPYTEHMKLFTKESWELLSKSLQNTVDTGEPYELELRTVRKDEANGWMWVRGEQVKDYNNNVIGMWGAAQDITSRKETEIKLTEKERSFELAIQSAKAGTLFMNFETGYLGWDKRSLDIYEISENEFPNNFEGWLKHVHPEDQQKSVDAFEKALQEGGVEVEMNYRIITGNNKLRYIHAVAFIDRNNEGKPLTLNGLHFDVSEKKKAEDEIRNSEAEKHKILQSINSGLYIYDFTLQKNTFTNKAYAKILGWSLDEINAMGEKFVELFHTDDIQTVFTHMAKLANDTEDNSYHLLYRFNNKQGNWVWCESIDTPFQRDENGKVTQFIGSFTDVTERVESEQIIKHEKERVENILEGTNAGTWEWEIETGISRFNKRWAEITGYTLDELLPHTVETWINSVHKDDIDYCKEKLDQHFKGELPYFDVDFRQKHKNGGYVWINSRGKIVKRTIDGKPKLITGIHTDITEHKIGEEKLTKSLAKLKESNQELQEFAYVASHDLQEPLRKVKNYIDLLDRHYSDSFDEKARKYMDVISSGANRMQILIKDILRLSRVATRGEEFMPADMNLLVEQVLDTLQVSIKESEAEIVFGKLPVIYGDQTQIGQLLQNLMGNSLKFKGEKKPLIKIEATQREGEWEFCVADNGIGFSPEFATRVFQVFQRLHTRDEYAGTGIGLAICKKIVERHGGKIWAESESGKGANFYFTIPKNHKNHKN